MSKRLGGIIGLWCTTGAPRLRKNGKNTIICHKFLFLLQWMLTVVWSERIYVYLLSIPSQGGKCCYGERHSFRIDTCVCVRNNGSCGRACAYYTHVFVHGEVSEHKLCQTASLPTSDRTASELDHDGPGSITGILFRYFIEVFYTGILHGYFYTDCIILRIVFYPSGHNTLVLLQSWTRYSMMYSTTTFSHFPPLTRGCSEGLDAFRFFFNQHVCPLWVHPTEWSMYPIM